jgi:hypothetical protein
VFSDHFGRIPVQSFVLTTLLDGVATAVLSISHGLAAVVLVSA